MEYVQDGTDIKSFDTVTISAAEGGGSHSLSGTTYAELKNNTGSAVTIQNPSPSIVIKAYGSTVALATATASSWIGLGTVTSTGSCSGDGGSYSDPETVTFTVNNLAPGQIVSKSGSFSLNVNGG